ncbi:SLATT domain-containing protein [Trinickia diaoshuihuensis]|uniref:SLATT domain-containing protein n=1 Tax=Trinickia diaoshuihuensis TaxID=2292265 RepID=UPI0013C34B75|nr:SLATT domain-containing protein [Trinickia diaoshuihuensis]
MEQRTEEIIAECRRQEESCLYTSTALYEWLKVIRFWRMTFVVLPIILGSLAGAKVLVKYPSLDWLTAGAALLAGLFPAIFKALDLDVSMKSISDSASRFKVLQDRFRQTSRISATKPEDELEEEFKALMERMDDARMVNPVIPERYFRCAQKKIKSGDYKFDGVVSE